MKMIKPSSILSTKQNFQQNKTKQNFQQNKTKQKTTEQQNNTSYISIHKYKKSKYKAYPRVC